jgi:hypothetical protein
MGLASIMAWSLRKERPAPALVSDPTVPPPPSFLPPGGGGGGGETEKWKTNTSHSRTESLGTTSITRPAICSITNTVRKAT